MRIDMQCDEMPNEKTVRDMMPDETDEKPKPR